MGVKQPQIVDLAQAIRITNVRLRDVLAQHAERVGELDTEDPVPTPQPAYSFISETAASLELVYTDQEINSKDINRDSIGIKVSDPSRGQVPPSALDHAAASRHSYLMHPWTNPVLSRNVGVLLGLPPRNPDAPPSRTFENKPSKPV
ncbi:hypothetical protein B0H14DRAFT_2625673 [Mycena olivaceomarginata]|nr:hypothetical protein B0H14DRAFT_2625673 [Mycena olivaceomarginata]